MFRILLKKFKLRIQPNKTMRVSVKAIVKNEEGKILALRRSASDPIRPLTWDLPGGNLEDGEDIISSLKREIQEEIGIEIDAFNIFDAASYYSLDGKFSVQVIYTAVVSNPKITLSHEHDEYRWLTRDEFLQLESTPRMANFVKKLT